MINQKRYAILNRDFIEGLIEGGYGMRIPKAQEIYRHFKGNLYQIVTIAEHTETGEQMVVYQAMYGDFKIYARPLEMFCSKVDREKYPELSQEYRFELQGCCGEAGKISPVEEPVKREPIVQEAVVTRQEEPEELTLDPGLLEFLDAETYTQRLNILTGMHHRITDEILTTMAIACDVEVEEGNLESRYQSLKNCLLTLDKYEISRD